MRNQRKLLTYLFIWIRFAYILGWAPIPKDYVPPRVVKPIKMNKVLHLGQTMKRWRNAYDDSETKGTYLDFETKSDCVRVNATYPMEIPNEFTWCAQYKPKFWVRPWGGQINLLQIGTTTHGKSVIQDFLNPELHHKNITGHWSKEKQHNATYRILAGIQLFGGGVGNTEFYIIYGNQYWWLTNTDSVRWNQWDSLCVGINLLTPRVVIYYNGEMFDGKVFEDESIKVNHEAAVNASYFDSPTATDIFIGCFPWQALGHEMWGHITNVNMFNRILTNDEMISMTDCSWSPLPDGNILNWETLEYTFYQTYNPEVNIPIDLICPRKNQTGLIYIPGPAFSLENAHAVCKKLKGELLSINTEEEFQESGMFFRSIVEEYANKYSNVPNPDEWNTKWAYEGGGVESYVTFVRNRSMETDEFATDKWYDSHTGKENEYLRWWPEWHLPIDHDVGWAVYVRGYLQSHNLDMEEEWWQDW